MLALEWMAFLKDFPKTYQSRNGSIYISNAEGLIKVTVLYGKHLFTLWVIEHWHRLPGETLESPSLEILRRHPDMILGTLLWVSLLEQGVGLDDLLPTSHFLGFWFCRQMCARWRRNIEFVYLSTFVCKLGGSVCFQTWAQVSTSMRAAGGEADTTS